MRQFPSFLFSLLRSHLQIGVPVVPHRSKANTAASSFLRQNEQAVGINVALLVVVGGRDELNTRLAGKRGAPRRSPATSHHQC